MLNTEQQHSQLNVGPRTQLPNPKPELKFMLGCLFATVNIEQQSSQAGCLYMYVHHLPDALPE